MPWFWLCEGNATHVKDDRQRVDQHPGELLFVRSFQVPRSFQKLKALEETMVGQGLTERTRRQLQLGPTYDEFIYVYIGYWSTTSAVTGYHNPWSFQEGPKVLKNT